MAYKREEWPGGRAQEERTAFSLEDILSEYGREPPPGADDGTDPAFPDWGVEPEPEPAPVPEEEPDLLEGLPAAVLRDPPRKRKTRLPTPPPYKRPERRRRRPVPPEKKGKEPDMEAETNTPPEPVSLEDVVGSTVDAVMSEREERTRRRTLFSRRELRRDRTPAEKPEVIGPEKPLDEAAAEYRTQYGRRRVPPAVLVTGFLPALLLILDQCGAPLPGGVPQAVFLFICLAASVLLCRPVFTGTPGAFLCGVSALAAACDCLALLLFPARAPAEPYGAAACIGLVLAQWSLSLESRGMFDTFRAASVDREPPWMVTDTEKGACKQRGAVPGFYTAAAAQDLSTRWQALFMPLTLAASVVFAALSSIGQGRPADFFLNWSAILAAGATLSLPLCWGLPWARLAGRLHNAGCAVAGWYGAERISRRKTMIVTDGDLFPPGSASLSGVRLYDNMEMDRAVSLAAAMTRASGCGLYRIFEDLRKSELGEYTAAEDFSFFEEGGYSAVVRGERVLLGTSAFLRKMGVPLPADLPLTTGMYLAVDKRLSAVFAVEYEASENVDFALKMMRTCRVTPVLAARDPNVTPALLRRKFRREIKVEYPRLADRVALSEAEFDRDLPRALLFREGLLPYAEAVVGSRRLCRGVRQATLLGLFSSMAGMLLAFYLVFMAQYTLLTPFTLLLFLLLWALPAYLLMDLF